MWQAVYTGALAWREKRAGKRMKKRKGRHTRPREGGGTGGELRDEWDGARQRNDETSETLCRDEDERHGGVNVEMMEAADSPIVVAAGTHELCSWAAGCVSACCAL